MRGLFERYVVHTSIGAAQSNLGHKFAGTRLGRGGGWRIFPFGAVHERGHLTPLSQKL